MANASDADNDVAIIPLDAIVPSSVAVPADLPTSECSDSFPGTFWGYGGDDIFSDSFSQPSRKRWAEEHYERRGKVLLSEFPFLFNVVDIPLITDLGNYLANVDGHLVQRGDSGGPLFQGDSKVCGVASRVFVQSLDCEFRFAFPPFECRTDVESHYTDTSRSEVRDWINGQVLDQNGVLKGTCNTGPEALRTVDSDGDLIPDACDPCPTTADPDYDVSVTPDADEDGIPDRCDNCPTVLNPRTMVGNTLLQSDLDGDQIGDACDWCTDPANPIPDQES